MSSVGFLHLTALLPMLGTVAFFLLEKYTRFTRLPYRVRQLIYGLFFGAMAVVGTELGIPVNGALTNCRDAAVITAGLFFGAPAGLLAGLIGGLERWLAAYWGAGTFTQLACSLSTLFAGIYAALLRRFVLEGKRPAPVFSFIAGLVIEVFHVMMVFLTHPGEPLLAMEVVEASAIPMIFFNGFGVMMSSLALSFLGRKKATLPRPKKSISTIVQNGLLMVVAAAFCLSTLFIWQFQQTIAEIQSESMLNLAIQDMDFEILNAQDEYLLILSNRLAECATQRTAEELQNLMEAYGAAEIHYADKNGIILESTDPGCPGLDLNEDERYRYFLLAMKDNITWVEGRTDSAGEEYAIRYVGIPWGEGLLLIGFDQVQADLLNQDALTDVTQLHQVGENGFLVVTDLKGQIVSVPAWKESEELSAVLSQLSQDHPIREEVEIDGTSYLYQCSELDNYRVLAFLPVEEAYQTKTIAVYLNAFLIVLMFAAIFILIIVLIRRSVTQPVREINATLSRITQGELDQQVKARQNQEFEALSEGINTTVDALNRSIQEAENRMNSELAFARQVQLSSLPKPEIFARHREMDLDAWIQPARVVGGDFYDFYHTARDTVQFNIADVSGKGVPGAMFMMRAKAELRGLAESGHSLEEVFTLGNKALCRDNDAGLFITAWQGSLNLKTGLLTFVNAGHEPPMIRRADGTVEMLKMEPGFVLAAIDTVCYAPETLQLNPGDSLLLYTDGVTDAAGPGETMYTRGRLLETLRDCPSEPGDICRRIQESLETFSQGEAQFDDITLLSLRYNGPQTKPRMDFDHAAIECISPLTEFVDGILEEAGCPQGVQYQLDIAIDEIFSNIVFYAYPEEPGPVSVEAGVEEDGFFELTFTDSGIPYNPLHGKKPDITLPLEERPIGGLGIHIVRTLMDEVQYHYQNDRNILILRKNLKGGPVS